MNRSQSKYFETARRMDEAFLALLSEKEFAFITVKEICKRAKVNRSTFYLHYETIGDLLDETVSLLNDRFLASFGSRANINIDALSGSDANFVKDEYLLPYLDFVKENRNAYLAIHEQGTVFGTEKAFRNMFASVFSPIMTRFGIPLERQPYMMAFYRYGMVAVITQWLQNDCAEDKETIAAIIKSCVGQEIQP